MSSRNLGDSDPMLQHVMLVVAALIQAVAFTEVAKAEYFALPLHMAVGEWSNFLGAVAIFQLIVIVWFGQLITLLGYELWPRAAFGFLDAFFPFALGAAEVQLVRTLERPRLWCVWLAIFFGLLCVAYLDFYRKMAARKRAYPERFGIRYEQEKNLNVFSAGILSLFFFGVATWTRFDSPWIAGRLYLAVNLLCLLFIFPMKRWWNDLRNAAARSQHGPPS